MKKKVLIVGPYPPPIHGESAAISYIVDSRQMNKEFDIKLVNTNRKIIRSAGKFSFSKIFDDFKHITNIFFKTVCFKKDIFYLSISQTKLGLLRDLIFINIASKRSNKIITHLHGNNLGNVIDDLKPWQLRFTQKTLSKVDVGIVLGQALKENYRGLVKNVKIVFNGIDESFITKEEIENKKLCNLQSEQRQFSVLYLSNLMEEKGYIKLIEAVVDILKKGKDIKLYLAGTIMDDIKYKKIMDSLKLENKKILDRIQYKGVVIGEEKKKLLLESDIMVLPTEYRVEGQPLSLIEGMAAGLPLVATRRGGIPDLIGTNGIILKNTKSKEIARIILKLLDDKEKTLEYSSESRQLFLSKFTLDKYIKEIISIFNS